MVVRRGEIVGLVGENGAGKSTLLSILAGYLQPDDGEIALEGVAVRLRSPSDALAAGIGLVHQHFSLVPTFTVREQLALAGWRDRSLPPGLAEDFGGDEVIEDLALGRRQRVEIARALVANPRVLLLDEPTSVLAPAEVTSLFAYLRELRGRGLSIVIVTHKMREVMGLVDRVVVMACGQVSGEFSREAGWRMDTEQEILRAMFGEARGDMPPDPTAIHLEHVDGPTVVSVSELEIPWAKRARGDAQPVSFDLPQGSVSVIVGIDGQGQRELAESMAGYRRVPGEVTLDGARIDRLGALERSTLGIALLVDDRIGEGGIGAFSIAENLALKRPRAGSIVARGLLRRGSMRAMAQSVIAGWGIQPPNPDARFETLSGGNMQRLLAARELAREVRLLIALNPVHGLDVRSAELVWSRLRDLASSGGSVLVFSTDLDEALAQADRIAVMADARVSTFEKPTWPERTRYGSMMVNGW